MGLELLLFSYAVGLAPILYGLWIVVSGRVRLTSASREPVRGARARLVGLFTLVTACVYYAIITWAWSKYDR